MKKFDGPALFLDRNDINTDEIIPARYLTENTKTALKPYILEDLAIPGFDPAEDCARARVIVTRGNFGCGSSREHAVWVLEANDINVVIAESFARIFRQNMFNCGMLAIELPSEDIESILQMKGEVVIEIDLDKQKIKAKAQQDEKEFSFGMGSFEHELVVSGGWLAYADHRY